jgi:hypothetical protein
MQALFAVREIVEPLTMLNGVQAQSCPRLLGKFDDPSFARFVVN